MEINNVEVEFFTMREVAKRYRLSIAGVLKKLKEGRLKGFKVGGTWRLYADQFREMESKGNS